MTVWYQSVVWLLVVRVALALALACSCAAVAQQAKRLNVIFLLTDDHRWDALGAMGNDAIRTPGIQDYDLLAVEQKKLPARKGFFYEHTYLGSPRLPKVERVVSTDLKYMLYTGHGYEELYDISKDPHETVNLAKRPSEKVRLERMRKRYGVLRGEVK